MKSDLSLAEARRIALAAQGFAERRPAGRVDARHLRRVIDRVGVVQIDSVNVLARAHYLPFFSRVGPYPAEILDRLAYRRQELFEYWGHAASFIPVERYPLFRHRMRAMGERWRSRMRPGRAEEFAAFLEEVRARGALAASDLENPGERAGPWWGWAEGKTALEYHYVTGALAVAGRRNFERLYDVPERVLPAEVLEAPEPPEDEAQRELIRLGARSLGVGTARDLRDYYRLPAPGFRDRLREVVDEGGLIPVRVQGWRDQAYLDPSFANGDARIPRRVRARALVAPFDPVVWERDRTLRLFGFDYRIEIYVPEPKRRYGYYVLPFLLGDAIVARIDLKADRAASALLARAAWLEPGHDPAEVAAALAVELHDMARWLALDRVVVEPRGDLAGVLAVAVSLGGAE